MLPGERVRCWGANEYGQLGLGHDVRTPLASPTSQRPDKLGTAAIAVAAGRDHTCAILDGGAVRCWGRGENGRLGRGDPLNIGDDELPSVAGDIDLGGPAIAIASGPDHSCAVLESGALRCWGNNAAGQLGLGHTATIGDDESPAAAGDVPIGAPVVKVALGERRTCVVTVDGGVRCWGQKPTGYPAPAVPCSCDDSPAPGFILRVRGYLSASDGGTQRNFRHTNLAPLPAQSSSFVQS